MTSVSLSKLREELWRTKDNRCLVYTWLQRELTVWPTSVWYNWPYRVAVYHWRYENAPQNKTTVLVRLQKSLMCILTTKRIEHISATGIFWILLVLEGNVKGRKRLWRMKWENKQLDTHQHTPRGEHRAGPSSNESHPELTICWLLSYQVAITCRSIRFLIYCARSV